MMKLSMRQRRLAAWAGFLAPVLFVGLFTLLGALRPGYDPLSTYVSALSLGPQGWIQIANFIVLGLLLLVFSRGVAAEFQSGKASRWGLILLTIMGALFVVSGPFVMDPMYTPTSESSVHGIIHGLAGGIIFIMMPITCFIYLRRFRADPNWQSLKWWTLGLGIIISIALLLLTITSKLPDLLILSKPWQGLIQRFIIVPFMLWVFLFGLGLLRRTR
jgi:hypothetical protein